MKRTLAWLAAASALFGCARPTPPEGEALGPALYETCAQCHGAHGEGMREFAAPSIAGLPEWYVRYQLEKFQSGARGAHAQDVNGLRMRAMARTLNHEGDLEAVATYVSAMPAPAHETSVEGDAEHGRELYRTCVQCHGGNGEGNVERHAPPLNQLDDWYIVSSLTLFKEGIRGANEADEWGITMRPMALGLADEQEMRDVAAFIRTLRGS